MDGRLGRHKELQGIPSQFFPIWGETLDYERGLPKFRQPPAFAEEGELIPTAEGYLYKPCRRVVPPKSASRLSTAGHVEPEDNSPMALPHQYEMGSSSCPTSGEQTHDTLAQFTNNQPETYGPSGEGSPYDMDIPFNPDHPRPDVFQDHRRVAPPAPPGSQLSSPTGKVEPEDPMVLPPSQNEYEMDSSSSPAPWPQTLWALAQSTNNQSYEPSNEGSHYDVDTHSYILEGGKHYVYEISTEQSATEEIREQTYPRAIVTPNMDTTSGSTRVPYGPGWNSAGPVYQYDQDTSLQTDIQMSDLFWPGLP